MIAVEVALFANLRKYHPDGEDGGAFRMEVPEGTTLDGLLELLSIPDTEMKQTFINSLRQRGGYVLQSDERVAIFPPIAGG